MLLMYFNILLPELSAATLKKERKGLNIWLFTLVTTADSRCERVSQLFKE